MMTPLVVMATTVAVWLLPAAGDVSVVDRTRNESSTYDVITGAPRNTSGRQLNYYRVSRIVFVYSLLFPQLILQGKVDSCIGSGWVGSRFLDSLAGRVENIELFKLVDAQSL